MTSLATPQPSLPRRRPPRKNHSGFTLVEVMVSTVLFTMMAVATLSAILQSRRMSEDNVAQATASVIAQGILEQVQLNPYDDIASAANLALKFTGVNNNNLASIQQQSLPWDPDSTTFRFIGALSDPANPASAILGVLIDTAYMDGATVIRPARYMNMQINITRTLRANLDNVEVVLAYRWQPPSRNLPGQPATYVTREIRTIRSEAPSF